MTEAEIIQAIAETLKLHTDNLKALNVVLEQYQARLNMLAERIAALERQVPKKLEPGGSAIPF